MKKPLVKYLNNSLCILLLLSLISCNLNLEEINRSSATDGAVRSAVARCIEEELKTLEAYTDEDVSELLNAKNLTGKEIVQKALGEPNGYEYLDFCYAINQTSVYNNSYYVMNSAKNLMPEDKYNQLKTEIDTYEKDIKGWASKAAKNLPPDQQEAFYKDLKSLVVKTSIMLVAAFVYAAIPSTVMWGKISAAAALSIGAGLAAGIVMDVYGYFSKGISPSLINLEDGESYQDLSFEDWVSKLKESTMATYAMTTAATSFITSTGINKVTGAIVLGIFTVYNATSAIQDMKKTYNFDA